MKTTGPKSPDNRGDAGSRNIMAIAGGLLLSGFASGGCALPEGPCGVPEIRNETNVNIEDIFDQLTVAIERGESVAPDFTCSVHERGKVLVYDNPALLEEDEDENEGSYKFSSNTVKLPIQVFSYGIDFAEIVFHEFSHAAEDMGDMEWHEWKQTFSDIEYHGYDSSEWIPGMYFDPECLDFPTCKNDKEYHASNMTAWAISPFDLDDPALARPREEARKVLGDVIVPAYSEIFYSDGFTNGLGEDNRYITILPDDSGGFMKISFTTNINTVVVERENEYPISYPYNSSFGKLQYLSISKSAKGLYVIAVDGSTTNLLELDFSSGDFSRIGSSEEINPTIVNPNNRTAFYDNKVFILSYSLEDVEDENFTLNYFDIEKGSLESVEFDLKMKQIENAPGTFTNPRYSNIDSNGDIVFYSPDIGIFYILDLNTGKVKSKTYDLGIREVNQIAKMDAGEFYALSESHGEPILLEGAPGDVRMRVGEIGFSDSVGVSGQSSAVVYDDTAYFGAWNTSREGTTIIEVSPPAE
ncbi:MAG: hypothetical protein WCT46_06545 [Candidatus Gracilibacteria bacterium]